MIDLISDTVRMAFYGRTPWDRFLARLAMLLTLTIAILVVRFIVLLSAVA